MKTTISPHIEGKKVNFLPRDSIESINIQSESSGMPFSTKNDNKQSSIKYSTTDKESNSLSRDKNFLADSFKEISVKKMKPARHTKSSKSKRRRYTLCAKKRAKPKIDTGINNSTKQIPKQIHKENAFSRIEMKKRNQTNVTKILHKILAKKVKIRKKTSLRNLDHCDFLRGPYDNGSHHSLNKSYDRINDLMRTSTRETKNVFKFSHTILSLNTIKDDASQLYKLCAGSVTIFPEANHERASVGTSLVADKK
ncbi:unnamed protein product [Moneuplotes crassus]|uniref:Uncharacterized protein n=1 Tax=Euplotes crassus TaxID=5936 RepID=A0AAD2CZA8_EUPCR|nr:unnamed protein product [Moneuplotes crassus]